MANVHCAAATQNFLALENHSLDVAWWSSLVEEGDKTRSSTTVGFRYRTGPVWV